MISPPSPAPSHHSPRPASAASAGSRASSSGPQTTSTTLSTSSVLTSLDSLADGPPSAPTCSADPPKPLALPRGGLPSNPEDLSVSSSTEKKPHEPQDEQPLDAQSSTEAKTFSSTKAPDEASLSALAENATNSADATTLAATSSLPFVQQQHPTDLSSPPATSDTKSINPLDPLSTPSKSPSSSALAISNLPQQQPPPSTSTAAVVSKKQHPQHPGHVHGLAKASQVLAKIFTSCFSASADPSANTPALGPVQTSGTRDAAAKPAAGPAPKKKSHRKTLSFKSFQELYPPRGKRLGAYGAHGSKWDPEAMFLPPITSPDGAPTSAPGDLLAAGYNKQAVIRQSGRFSQPPPAPLPSPVTGDAASAAAQETLCPPSTFPTQPSVLVPKPPTQIFTPASTATHNHHPDNDGNQMVPSTNSHPITPRDGSSSAPPLSSPDSAASRIPLPQKNPSAHKRTPSATPLPDNNSSDGIWDPFASDSEDDSLEASDPADSAPDTGYREWIRRRREWTRGCDGLAPLESTLTDVPESAYPGLYNMLVRQARPLRKPLPLADALVILKAGWVATGQWPPPSNLNS